MKKLITLLGILAASCSPLPAQNTLAGNLTVQQSVKFTGDITPPQLTADVNDYAPASFAAATIVRVSADAPRVITGLAGGADGRIVWLSNIGGNAITLANAFAGSSAANRFDLGGANYELAAGNGLGLWYDATASRWRPLSGLAAGGGGGSSGTVTSVAVSTANGVSATVANPTTTPTLTFSLGAISPGSVAAAGNITGANLSGTNTGDQSDATLTFADVTTNNVSTARHGFAPKLPNDAAKYLDGTGTWSTPAGGSGGSGTVTSVSVVTANGVSGTVANASTTPAITLSLGAITPSSVAASGSVTGSNLSGTNTGDQTNITGNAGTATALQTARTINGVSFDGTANISIPAGTGTVTGPASSTDNALVRFDSTTGTSIQNSTITLADTGALAGVDAAQFVATPTSAAADRSLRWNSTEKTLDLVNGDGTTTQLGHEQHVVIHNATGSALAEGKVVSLTGATLGGRLTAALARADQYSTSDATIGITTQAIANGVEGKVTTSGIIHDLDTSAFSPGDELYLSDTVAGGLRTTQPLAPNLVVHVGHVVVSDAVVGSIYVDPAVVSQTADSVHIDAGPGILEMNNVQDFFRHAWSTGATEGFALTDNGNGTVNIATGEIVYRETDADDAVLTPTVVPAVTNLVMQADNVSYLYLQYGTGWQVGTALNQFDGITKVIVYLVGRNGNRLNVVDLRKINVDFGRKSRRQKAEFDGFVFGGWWRSVEAQSAITSSGLNLLVGAGKYFYFDNAITHAAFDTTVAGGADANNWITFYNRSSWAQITGQKAVNNTQWDNAGTLTAFSGGAGAARFRTDYIYVVMDGASPYLASIMGNVEYTSLATAQAAPLPSLPPHIDGIAVLVGQVVVRKNGTTVTVQRAGAASFSGTVASNLHNSLPDLQGGTVGEYYHTTAAQNGWLPTGALGTAAYTAATAYDPAGAAAAITLAGLGGVPTSRTVNGHALSADVTVTKGDVGLGSVENTALSTWGGSANLATLGTVTAGTWQGSAITDTYVASASAWNAKVSFPGFGTTNTTATVGDDARLSDARTPLAHNQAWSTITTTPTTLTGYGITDAQPLDSDLTSIAALTTTAFGRGLLTQVDAAGTRTTIGAGTSSFDGAYASLSGIPSTFTPAAHNQAWSTITTTPTTLSGYGIADAQPLDSDLTSIAALSATGIIARTGAGTASTRTITGTANQVTVTNGDGVAGNPTLALPQSIATTSTPQFSRIGVGVAADATTPLTIYTTTGTSDVLSMVSTGASGPSSSANFRLAVDDGAGMSSGDRLGAIFFGGNDSSTQFNSAIISAFSTNDWTPGSRSSRIDFSTTNSANNRAVRFSILDTGLVRLHSYGAGTLVTDSSGNVTASSDRRLKNVSGEFTRGLDAILQIQPKFFTWKPESGMNTDDLNVGFIAQDVQDAIPEAVGTMNTSDVGEDNWKEYPSNGAKRQKRETAEFLTLSDRPIIAALVNAVKELKAENDDLRARVATLESGKASK